MKKIILVAFLIIFIVIAKAQGLIFDSTAFSQREQIEETRAELPLSASLKMYTPLLYPQVNSTCVAHSFANARTILFAKQLNWTDKNKITRLSFSPYYIYYRNKDAGDIECKVGLNIESAAKDVLNNGIAPIVEVEYPNYYPFSDKALCIENNGISYPPSMAKDVEVAKKYKIDMIYRVSSVTGLKTALASGMPVILCMYAPESFNKLRGDIWIPQASDKIERKNGHALIAIGYDENKYGGAIEIMNSWGDTWGNKGFTWVKYKDYLKWFVGGYALYCESDQKIKATNNPDFKPEKAKIEKKVMKLKSNDGKSKVKFDNSEYIKSFQSSDNKE